MTIQTELTQTFTHLQNAIQQATIETKSFYQDATASCSGTVNHYVNKLNNGELKQESIAFLQNIPNYLQTFYSENKELSNRVAMGVASLGLGLATVKALSSSAHDMVRVTDKDENQKLKKCSTGLVKAALSICSLTTSVFLMIQAIAPNHTRIIGKQSS